jgi:hypothetical protein
MAVGTKQPKRFAHAKAGKSPMKLGNQAKSGAVFDKANFAPAKLSPDNEKTKDYKQRRKK